MEFWRICDINIYSLAILLILIVKVRHISDQIYAHRLFKALIKVAMILLVSEMLTWVFNGRPGLSNHILLQVFNLIEYLLTIVPAVLWCLYADYQIFGDKNRTKKLKYVLSIFVLINTLFSVASLYNGMFFFIDGTNVYHRGDYFWLHVLLSYGLVLYTTLMIFHYRNRVEKKNFYSMLLFPLPQLIGGILQLSNYGLSLLWSGLVLSILIVYINIQDHGLNTDYLTGAYNRRLLDYRLKNRIKNCTKDKSFSGILIDIDNFKQINDTYGHDMGDKVLQDVVQIIRSCLTNNDLIARLGGDEFFIILDQDDPWQLRQAARCIVQAVELYNSETTRPYQIKLSMGYDVFDHTLHSNAAEFMNYVDLLMYAQKKAQT